MNRRISFLVTSVLMLSCVLLFAGCENSHNRHVWILPNHEKIEYYEGPNEGVFTANIPEYVSWTSDKRGTNNSCLGYNGGFESLELRLNQSQTLAWIAGLYAGQTKPDYVAIIDVANFKIVDADFMWGSESNINSSEIKLKREIELSNDATANVVKEQ